MPRFDDHEFDVELAISLLLQGDREGFQRIYQNSAPNLSEMMSYLPSEVIPNDVDEAAHLMQIYRKAGNANSAGRCALRMVELSCSPTEPTLNLVLSACAQKGDLKMLWAWWSILMSAGYQFNFVSFNILLNACARSRNQHHAECCIRAMVRQGKLPSLVGFTSLIDCLAKAGNVDKAEAWFDEVLDLGMKPDVYLFNVIINAVARAGDVGKALRLVASMRHYGLCPDTKTYNCLIDACAASGDSGMVERLLQNMKSDRVKADGHTFGSLVNVYSKCAEVERCVFWLEQMIKAGIQPTVLCYNMIIHACAQRGDPRQAEEWLSRMERQGMLPTGVTYGSLLNAYSRANDWEGVVACVERMVGNGFGVDHVTLCLLIKSHGERDRLVGQKQAWEAYSLVIRTLLRVNDVKNLKSLFVDLPLARIPEQARAAHAYLKKICVQAKSDAELMRALHMEVNNSSRSFNCRTSNIRCSTIFPATTREDCARLSRLLSEGPDTGSTVAEDGRKPLASTHKSSDLFPHTKSERIVHPKKERQRHKPPASGYSHVQATTQGIPREQLFDNDVTSGSTTAVSQSQSDDGGSSQDKNRAMSPCRQASDFQMCESFFL